MDSRLALTQPFAFLFVHNLQGLKHAKCQRNSMINMVVNNSSYYDINLIRSVLFVLMVLLFKHAQSSFFLPKSVNPSVNQENSKLQTEWMVVLWFYTLPFTGKSHCYGNEKNVMRNVCVTTCLHTICLCYLFQFQFNFIYIAPYHNRRYLRALFI